jgi:alpha-glucosidase
MYERETHYVRDAIKFRYRLMPFFYTQLWLAHVLHQPIVRPLFYDHEEDPNVWQETDDFMLGTSLLVASVVERQQTTRTVYLPDNAGRGWHDFYTGKWHAGGQQVVVPTKLETMPLFVKSGSGVPMAEDTAATAVSGGTMREVRLYPSPAGGPEAVSDSKTVVYEDDGTTTQWNRNKCCVLVVRVQSTATTM